MSLPLVITKSAVNAFALGKQDMMVDDTAEGFVFGGERVESVIERITLAHTEVRRDVTGRTGSLNGSAYTLAVEWDEVGASVGLLFALDNGASPDVVYGGMLPASAFSFGNMVGEYVRSDWSGGVDGHLFRGDGAYPDGDAITTPETSAGNGAGWNHGAASATQASLLQVWVKSFSGTSISFNVEHAASDSWPGTDIFTDLTFSAAGHAQATPVIGALTNTWRRLTWTGTFSSCAFYAAFSTEP